MANDIGLFLSGAFCAYFVYCFFVYFENLESNKQKAKELKEKQEQEQPEIGAYYRPKSDPFGDRLVLVVDVKENFVKYNYYSREFGAMDKNTLEIRRFFSVYTKNEDQNIKIESQS